MWLHDSAFKPLSLTVSKFICSVRLYSRPYCPSVYQNLIAWKWDYRLTKPYIHWLCSLWQKNLWCFNCVSLPLFFFATFRYMLLNLSSGPFILGHFLVIFKVCVSFSKYSVLFPHLNNWDHLIILFLPRALLCVCASTPIVCCIKLLTSLMTSWHA